MLVCCAQALSASKLKVCRRIATTKSSSPPVSPSGSGPKLRLSLDRFAFSDSSANAPAVAVQKEPAPSDEKPKCLRRRRPHYSIVKGVSRASVSRLARCVCCETRWTVKKTAAQKLSHMDACSRRCSYSPETMTFLIKKELNVTKEAAVDDAEADTHLQSIVQNAGSKKRRRTKGPTVQQYTSQTREIILKRARRILGPTMDHEENDAFLDLPVSTQAVVPQHSMVSTDVVALDVSFRPSKLRYRSCEGTDLKVSPLIGPLESM